MEDKKDKEEFDEQAYWETITSKPEVVKLFKQRENIERKIRKLDKKSLVLYELQALMDSEQSK